MLRCPPPHPYPILILTYCISRIGYEWDSEARARAGVRKLLVEGAAAEAAREREDGDLPPSSQSGVSHAWTLRAAVASPGRRQAIPGTASTRVFPAALRPRRRPQSARPGIWISPEITEFRPFRPGPVRLFTGRNLL